MKVVITGGKGFVGTHLTKLLEQEGCEVHSYDLIDGYDITDKQQLKNFLAKLRPAYIYHLAAVTSVPESFQQPLHCMAVNVGGSINLLETIRELELTSNVLLASSTEVYSPAIDDTPLDVSSPVQPHTPYGVSKLAMEQMGAIYASSHGLHIVVTRTNNHTGPGQDGPFAVTSFARQIAAIERGEQEELVHGDLSAFRSYLDVRDVVRAYRTAIDMQPYVYNISSEQSIEMQDLLNRLMVQAKVPIKTSTKTSLMRPTKEHRTTYRTSSKLKEAGWQPEYDLERTLYDVLNYWRNRG